MTEPNDPIDYSRPVGWWCPVCGHTSRNTHPRCWARQQIIPVYLPLPTPEPVEVDEVETGEAEVVTWTSPWKEFGPFRVGSNAGDFTVEGYRKNDAWFAEFQLQEDPVGVINRIAAASANARKKRGMK
jgi:hypothetical protein